MKVALYARVSTRDKDQNPEVQLSQLREFCQREGHEIIGEFVDQASASDFVRRTAWAKLMKAAATRQFKGLIVWKLDRAFRDTVMALTVVRQLRGYGIDVMFATQPELSVAGASGDLMLTIYAGFAQFEKDQIRERVNAGLALARKEGRVLGRKRLPLTFINVLEAHQEACEQLPRVSKGNQGYSLAARIIKQRHGVNVTPGFVQNRILAGAEGE